MSTIYLPVYPQPHTTPKRECDFSTIACPAGMTLESSPAPPFSLPV